MRIKYIESIIDSIDPYFLSKDLGITLIDDSTIEELDNADRRTISSSQKEKIVKLKQLFNADKTNDVSNDFICCEVNGQIIRVLPYGYLNTSVFSGNFVPGQFIAGSCIDFLAFTLNNDYDAAFKLFFRHYSTKLRSQLAQDPSFIEKLVKGSYIRRNTILKTIVTKLFLNNNYQEGTVRCRNWAQKQNIEDISGYGYFDTSKNIYNMLIYFDKQTELDFYADFCQNGKKVDQSNPYSDFINNHLFKEGSEWIVVPYFSDFHIVSALKFINPKDNSFYFLPLSESKLSYAGLYRLTPNLNFIANKIRLTESDSTALILGGYARQMLNHDSLFYLSVAYDKSGMAEKTNLCTMAKPIFLYEKHSNLPLIKAIYDSLLNKSAMQSDLFVCRFSDLREDSSVYTFEAFLESQFKELVDKTCKLPNGNTILSKELSYFISGCDFNNRLFKKHVLKWLLDNELIGIYEQLVQLNEESFEFKNWIIKPTINGYIASNKSDSTHTNDVAITNFIIKVDQNIIFQDIDDILHRGRLLMGNNIELPITFYKKEIHKGRACDAIEKIALKGFAHVMPAGVDMEFDDSSFVMPTIFDSKYTNALMALLKKEITTAPCKYGSLQPGWDKSNGIFNATSWQATSLRSVAKAQYIYSLTAPVVGAGGALTRDIQNCFTNLPIDRVSYQADLSFLNKNIKDIIGALLASLYRTYLGYGVQPIVILDSVNARNLIKFIFSTLGQIKPLELPANPRLLKNNGVTLLETLNRYPIYARCDHNPQVILSSIQDYPLFLFVKENEIENCKVALNNQDFSPYTIDTNLNADTYKQVASFAQDTLLRFFKWLFKVSVQEFELSAQETANQDLLIEEGNLLFNYLWWEDVISECDKTITPEAALKGLFSVMTNSEIKQHINYYPEQECYVIKRLWLKDEARKAAIVAYRALKQNGKAWRLNNEQYYMYVDKDFFEACAKDVMNKSMKPVQVTNIFVSPELAITQTRYHTPKRSITKHELIKRITNNAPGYTPEKLKIWNI